MLMSLNYTVNCSYNKVMTFHYLDEWWFITITMMTSSNGNIFRVTGPLCGEFTGICVTDDGIDWVDVNKIFH